MDTRDSTNGPPADCPQLSRRQLEQVLESVGDALTVVDLDWRIIHMSPLALKLAGQTHQALLGRDFWEAFPKILGTAVEAHLRRAMAERTPVQFEVIGPITGRWHNTSLYPSDDGLAIFSRDVHDRKRAEIERSMLAAIVASSDDAIYSLTPDGVIASWNAGAERLYGYTTEEAIGRPLTVIIPEDRRDEDLRCRELVARGERVEHFETVRVTKGGRRIVVSLAVSPIHDAAGRVVGWSKVARDVTERKKSVEALRRSQEQFTRFMENLPGLAWIKALDGRYVYANSTALRVFGAGADRVLGRTDAELFPPETAAQFVANDRQALVRPAGLQTIEALKHDDGVVHHSIVSKFGILDAEGAPVGVGGMAIDMTERVNAEAAVRDTAERLTLALDAARLGDWSWDAATDVVTLSPRAAEVLGVPPGAAPTRAELMEMIHADDRAETMAEIQRQLTVGHRYDVDYRISRLVGGVVWVSSHGRFRLGLSGHVIGMYGLVQDITVRKLLEHELRHRADQLTETDRRKDEFLAILGHELRNPLAPIRNALEVLQQRGDSLPDARELHELIERQVRTLSRLTDEMLDISRVTRGKVELHREQVDVAAVVGRAVETSRPLIEERGHRLTVSLPAGPLRVYADAVRLEQVLANLLNNAAKYTPPSGQIWLEAERDAGVAVLRVRDTGIGIRPEVLPRLFEPFQQADRVPGRVQEGLGIGLALVRGLVELHGGTVEVTSAGAGKGSEFTVRLPLAADQTSGHEAGKASVEAKSTPRHVLVVDDNVDAAETLAMLLRMKGHVVECVHDGESALAAAAEGRPEFVLLDIGMPGMDGYEVARRLRADASQAGVILVAVTGYGQEEDRQRSRAAGFDEHFVKPLNPKDLRDLFDRRPT